MKKLFIYFTFLSAGLSLFSCSPRVLTNVVKTYPASSSPDSVYVFMADDPVPNSAERLGTVQVLDRGTTTRCKFDQVMQLAKEETAKTGGNGLLITDHKEPSIWGSSCHQIAGLMLRLSDMTVDTQSPHPVLEYYTEQKQVYEEMKERSRAPANTLTVSAGYGWITSKTYTPYGTYNSKGGMEWKIEYDHVYGSGLGFGIQYSGFHASFSSDIYMRLTYIAPSFIARFKANSWVFKFGVGIGYFGYNDSGAYNSSNIGMSTDAAAEYMLSPHFGLGVSLSTITGRTSGPYDSQLPDGEISGVRRINLQGGLRYYF